MINAYIEAFATPIDYHTESANTAIVEYINPPSNGTKLVFMAMEYTVGANAHIASLMYPGNFAGARTTANAAANAAQKIIQTVAAPTDGLNNTIAASDIVAYETDAGWEWNTVTSVSGNNVTHTNNLAGNVAAGAKYRVFGVVGDNVAFQFYMPVNATYQQDDKILAVHPEVGVPFFLSISNNIAAGYLRRALFAGISPK